MGQLSMVPLVGAGLGERGHDFSTSPSLPCEASAAPPGDEGGDALPDRLSRSASSVGWSCSRCFFHDDLHPNSPVYWLMMQIGMCIGFLTSYPSTGSFSGVKEPM